MKSTVKKIIKKILFSSSRNEANRFHCKKYIKGNNNIIKYNDNANLIDCTFNITGNNNTIVIDEFCSLKNVTFYINGSDNKIHLSQRVKFRGGGEIWIEDYQCEVEIGECSTFENVHLACTEPHSKIEIGRDCMFAYDIDVRTGDSHSILSSQTKKRINYAKNIKIGNHVWVASHVSILKGVQISDNTVIATRSVVTKSFEEKNILIGGVVAKQIKSNIDWDRRRIYEDS